MTARAAALLVATVVAGAILAAVVHHRVRPTVRGAAQGTTADASASGEPVSAAHANLPPAPSIPLATRDGAAAATLWQARAALVMLRKQRKLYGAETARLMQQPYDEAWDALMALADEGDAGAMSALAQIASMCSHAREPVSPERAQRPASAAFRDLPEAWRPFIDRIAELQKQDWQARLAHCVDRPFDVVTLMIDRLFASDDPALKAEILADNDDTPQAIADLRALIDQGADPQVEFMLGDLLLQSRNPAEQSEGRSLLERLAANQSDAAVRLAHCLAQGCGAFAGDPPAARAWLELAAGAGDPLAFALLFPSLDADGETDVAWAWSLYQLDLAIAGCLELGRPTYLMLASAAAAESKYRAALSPAEQNAGRAAYYAISGRYANDAKARLACAD